MFSKYKKLIFIVSAAVIVFGFVPSALAQYEDLPGIDLTIERVSEIIYAFACWLWSVSIFILIIFIILAGVRFMYAGGDPKKIGDARQNFKYVILGAIVVMGTFVIIATLAYNIGVDISFIPFDCSGSGTVIEDDGGDGGPICGANGCEAGEDCQVGEGDLCCPSDCGGGDDGSMCGDGTCDASAGEDSSSCPSDCPGTQPTPTPTPACLDGQALATKYGTRYPAGNAPELDDLIQCIIANVPVKDLGSVLTYENTQPLCNYTRGNRDSNSCTTIAGCSYVVNSCHYGGRTGSTGARAVNFGNEAQGNAIIQAAQQCGAKSARCQTSDNRTVTCPLSGNNPNIHVYVNTTTCDTN